MSGILSKLMLTDNTALEVSDDTILFVIKPRGFMTPVDENRLPKFYYIHKPHGSPEGLKYAGVRTNRSITGIN